MSRALAQTYKLGLKNEGINGLAYECEKAAHGTPSGIDNTLATYDTPLLYQQANTADSPFYQSRRRSPGLTGCAKRG